jgi:hypothetical protein
MRAGTATSVPRDSKGNVPGHAWFGCLTYYGWDTAVAIRRQRRRIFRTSKTDHPAAPNPPSNGA